MRVVLHDNQRSKTPFTRIDPQSILFKVRDDDIHESNCSLPPMQRLPCAMATSLLPGYRPDGAFGAEPCEM